MVFKRGGRNCAVFGCHQSIRKNGLKKETDSKNVVSMYYFPKDPKLRKEWAVKIKTGKQPTKWTQVCSDHFSEEDFRYSRTGKCNKRFLLKAAVPSRNLPLRSVESRMQPKPPRHGRKFRSTNILGVTVQGSGEHTSCLAENGSETTRDVSAEENNLTQADFTVLHEFASLAETVGRIEVTKKDAEVQVNTIFSKNRFSIDACVTDLEVSTATGFQSKQLFKNIVREVTVIEKANSIGYTGLDSEHRVLMTAMKLKHNLSYALLAILFKVSQRSVSTYFKSMLVVLKAALQFALFFPSIESVRNNLPVCFQPYGDTRVVLDCTEIPVERPKCLNCRFQMYSNYKGTYTTKFLIGVTPSGMISLVSNAYGGRCSDKFITNDCGVLDMCQPYIDAVMVDKGFMIEHECSERSLKLYRPPFLRKKSQFNAADAIENQRVAAARVHVERAIQRLKVFAIGSERLEIELVPFATEIVTICACLVNLSSPILSDERF